MFGIAIHLTEPLDAVATGVLDEDISDGTYSMTMTGVGGVKLLDCSGDASKAQECPVKVLGFKVGSLSFQGVTFPVKKGTISGIPKVTIALPSSLPKLAAKTTTHLAVGTKSGDKIICVDITTSAAGEAVAAEAPAVQMTQPRHEKEPNLLAQMRQRVADVPHPVLFAALAGLLWVLAMIAGRRKRRAILLQDEYDAISSGSTMQV